MDWHNAITFSLYQLQSELKYKKKASSTFGKINKYKLDPIAKQTLFLQKENGGFNLKEPEITKTPTCGLSYILTYIRYLQNMKINKIKSSNPKTPFYYFDLVDYIKKNQNTTITKEKPQSKTIYQNILNHQSTGHITFFKTMWKTNF